MNTDNVVGITVGEVKGLRADFEEKLASENGREWLEAFKLFLKRKNPWVIVKNTTAKAKEKLLELVTTVKVKGTKQFIAKDCFKKGNADGVKIYDIYPNFKTNFLGKTEEDIPDADIKVHKLLKSSRDPKIITELGDNCEIYLTYVWSLMKLQPNGEEGVLLTNGYANIFYVKDEEGVLWVVDVRWCDDGWYVFAYSVEYSDDWLGGYRVLSR